MFELVLDVFGLGAYHARVYEAFQAQQFDWLCGSSIGAVEAEHAFSEADGIRLVRRNSG
ncbi:hypothetical protein ACQR1W_29995 [Bradyrhizobium sp. HKCCYLS1011]|uniref:hypothetical protein n=1 Tax=Bradyrhizobium sp. HKCCYLS1011 TaxID=3420733 RepID=UPI003EB9AEC9